MLNIILKSSQVVTSKGVTEKVFLSSSERGQRSRRLYLDISGKCEDIAESKEIIGNYIRDYNQLKKRGY